MTRPARTRGWIWTGRVVALLIVLGAAAVWPDAQASSIALVVALAVMVAPQLLPRPQRRKEVGTPDAEQGDAAGHQRAEESG